jgi:hypothetical protein
MTIPMTTLTTTNPASPLAAHRRRQTDRGLQQLELQVPRDDAALLRVVAAALVNPDRAAEARAVLRRSFAPAVGLKALLMAAPLEDVEFERDRDLGRDIAL